MVELAAMNLGSGIIISNVQPQLDGGFYAVKRIVGDELVVTANVLRHGHELLTVVLRYDIPDDTGAHEISMTCVNPGLDLWEGRIHLNRIGVWRYRIDAWVDRYGSWRADLKKRIDAGQDVASELLEGMEMVRRVKSPYVPSQVGYTDVDYLLSDEVAHLLTRHADRTQVAHSAHTSEVVVDRPAARFAAWYELFPRSQGPITEPERSGTFRDCIDRLPDVAAMGFDVIYLPPIHPIGRSHRKGKNNNVVAQPGEPGSPWAIGNELGGHDAIEPSLGTIADFDALVRAARDYGIEIALDFAIQCSPDHPWVKEHPAWFSHRPDGTIKYAENPPKKYQDIYPINFETDDWSALWNELKRVVLFWVGHGVTTFRVDNPHTKPIPFWEWLIREVKNVHPEVIFLAEAFTRPRMMEMLAKVGFTQSYTYFTWRNGAKELAEYLTELTQSEMVEYYRGHFFANTPDILHEYLQKGGVAAFKIRYLLAATLSSLCGIYSGYELCENVPVKPGSEEYLDSEKYEIKPREWHALPNLSPYLTIINRTRREHPALQLYDNLRFHAASDPNLLCHSKVTPDGQDAVIVVANLDPHQMHEGIVQLDLEKLGMPRGDWFQVRDQFSGQVWEWGDNNYVRLDPQVEPGHLLVVGRK